MLTFLKKKPNNKNIPLNYIHPTEIQATLSAAREVAGNNKIYAVFQAHTYSRALAFINDFAEALKEADFVVVTDIFPAREKDPGTISGESMSEYFINKGINSKYISDFSETAALLRYVAKKGDVIITLGAGDVNKVISKLI